MKDCLICHRIEDCRNRINPYFIAELPSGYVVLGDNQFYRGYTLFLSKLHKKELHELSRSQKMQFLMDMAVTAEAVCKAFKFQKLNYEMLGNKDPHLHWHLFPRYITDPNPLKPIWVIDEEKRTGGKLNREQIDTLKEKILRRLLESTTPLSFFH